MLHTENQSEQALLSTTLQLLLLADILAHLSLLHANRGHGIAQNDSPLKFRFRPENGRATAIALLPLIYPMMDETACFGGIWMSM